MWEMREDGSLGAGTCFSLINYHLFSAWISGGADILGSPWVASLPSGFSQEWRWVSAIAVTGRSPGTSTLRDTGFCPLVSGGWRSCVCISVLRLQGDGVQLNYGDPRS